MIGNELRRHAATLKNGIFGAERESARRDTWICIAEYAVRFLLAMLLTRTDIFGGCSPFAVGFSAAAPSGFPGTATFAGAILGYLAKANIVLSLKYISMLVLNYASSIVFRKLKFSARSWFSPLIAGFSAACVGFVYASDAGWTPTAISIYLTETVLITGSAYFYRIALTSAQTGGVQRSISILLLAVSLLSALSAFQLFGVLSIGRAAAALAVLFAAYRGGAGMGCACGIVIGLVMDASAAQTPFFGITYSLAAIAAGAISKRGRLPLSVTFVLTNAAAALFIWDRTLAIPLFYEVFVASVLFLILPAGFITKAVSILPAPAVYDSSAKAREYARERIEKTALAFRELYETVKNVSGDNCNDSNIAALFDRAADAVCRKCRSANDCWSRNYTATLDALNSLTPAMAERGAVQKPDFPGYFLEKCRSIDALTAAINEELRALYYRQQYRSRLRDSRGAAYNQYADISAVLDGLAADLGSEIAFEPELEKKLRKYLRSQGTDANVSVFRSRSGRLRAEIQGENLYLIKKDRQYLDKLSAVLGVRLCTALEKNGAGRLMLLEAEPLAADVGLAASRKRGERVSGDTGAYFKTDDGILYVLLSDGMGTGDQASASSASAARILERFLRAGVSPEAALHILNDLMLLRNETDTTCATIDLLCIDLFSGDAKIFKYGAAPSYIKVGASVRRIKCKSLAPGLGLPSVSGDEQAYVQVHLPPTSFAIIASDGVIAENDDAWLRELIAGYSGTDAKALSKKILRTAQEHCGTDDDMTVLVIHTKERP